MQLVLRVRPRVAPLGWPHVLNWTRVMGADRGLPPGRFAVVDYSWVFIKPDGSGWTADFDPSCIFLEKELDAVLERFYESVAGPYPFDFQLTTIEPVNGGRYARGKTIPPVPVKTKPKKKRTKAKRTKR